MSPNIVPSQSDLSVAKRRLAGLEETVGARERELETLQQELHALQTSYFERFGDLYRELIDLQTAVMEAEVRAGIRRPPVDEDEESEASESEATDAGRPKALEPSDDLKRMFRDLAKAIHPDRATDDVTRFRRHSLMAEANRAYAERDEDRLRLIMRAWERSPGVLPAENAGDEHARVNRRIADLEERLVVLEGYARDLRTSAIFRLKTKVDDARAQGWDLFAEMMTQVRREIANARARLRRLEA